MDSTDQQILNRLNKHESRRANTLNTKFPENESIVAAPIIYGNEIWMDAILIPRDGANLNTVKALSNGATYTDTTTGIAVVRRYINAATTSVNSSRLVFYNANLIDAIPSLFLTTKEYTIRLYKNVAGTPGVEIPYKSGEWDVDNTSGILRFYKSADYVLTMLGTLPPFVSFWRYIGRRMDTVLYSAISTAESALPIVGGTMEGNIDMNTHDLIGVGAITTDSIDIGTGNATIDAAGNVECQNLTVNGTLTTIESQTILIGDNTLVINNGPMGSRDAGYLIERYVTDVVADTPTLSNVSQATTSTTIQLNGGSSSINDFYVGTYIKITASEAGGAVGQVRLITGYVGATKTATIDQVWTTIPSAISSYSLYSSRLVGHVYNEADEMFRFGYYQRDSQTSLEPVRYANTRADYNIAARLLVGTDNLDETLEDGQARIGNTLIMSDRIILNADVQGGDGVELRRRNGSLVVNRGDPGDVTALYWRESGTSSNWVIRSSGINYTVAATRSPIHNTIAVHYKPTLNDPYSLLTDATFSYNSDNFTMSVLNASITTLLTAAGVTISTNLLSSTTTDTPLRLTGNGTGLVEFVCAPVAQGPYMAINYSQTGVPTLDGYLQFVRGSSTAASIYWNETLDRFTCGLDTDQQRIARLGSGIDDQRIPIYNAAADTLIFDSTFFYDTITGTLNVNNIMSTNLTFGVDDGVSFIKDGNIYTDAGMLYNDTTNKLTLTGALESASITLPAMTIASNTITTTIDDPSFDINIFTGGFFNVLNANTCFSRNILVNFENNTANVARDIFITFGRGLADSQSIEWNETAGRFRIGTTGSTVNIARIDNNYADTYVPFYSLSNNRLLATNVAYDGLTSTLNSVNQAVTTALSVAQVAINTNKVTTVAGSNQNLVLAADGTGVIQVNNTISYSPSVMTLNLASANTPANNVTIDIYRGLSTAARIGWNETSDSFECGVTSNLLPIGRVAASVTNRLMPYFDTTANAFVSDGQVSYNPDTQFMSVPTITTDAIKFSDPGTGLPYEGSVIILDNNFTTTLSTSLYYKNNRLGLGIIPSTYRLEVSGSTYSSDGLTYGPGFRTNSRIITTFYDAIVYNTNNIYDDLSDSIRYWYFGDTTATTGNAALAVFLANNTSTINHYLAANNAQITYFCANNGTVVIGGTTNTNTRKLLVNGSFEASSIYLTGATTDAIPYITTGGQLSIPTNFVWKQSTQRLGIGNTAPAQTLDITGTACISSSTYLTSLTTDRIMVVANSGLVSAPADMRYIALTGNVSIGTGTDPTEKLEVGGRVSAIDFIGYTLDNSGILFSSGNVIASGAPNLVWNDGNLCMGIGTDQPVYNLHNVGTTSTNSLYINTELFSDSSRNITPNNITSTGNKFVWDNATARLGINVAVPSTPLDVKSTGSNTSAQQIKSSGDAVLFSFDQGTTDQGILRVRDASGVEKIRFNSEADSFINGTSAGLLIGTTTNTNLRKLLIAGSTESTGILYASQTDDATSANSGSIQSAGGMSLAKNLVIGGLTSGSIPFINSSKAVSESTVVPFFWDATNSRLGVGTNSPGYRISSDSTIHTATGFACANNTGLTVVSTISGTQIMNNDITPSSGNLTCEFRFGRNTSTTGDMSLLLHSPGTTTVNHSFVTNNSKISYMCANNGTVVIGGTTNAVGYKLLVSGTFSTTSTVTFSNYSATQIPFFGTGGLLSSVSNFTWNNSTQCLGIGGAGLYNLHVQASGVSNSGARAYIENISNTGGDRDAYLGIGSVDGGEANLVFNWRDTGSTTFRRYNMFIAADFNRDFIFGTDTASNPLNSSVGVGTDNGKILMRYYAAGNYLTLNESTNEGVVICGSTNTNSRQLLVNGTAEVTGVFRSTSTTAVSAVGTAGAVFSGGVSIAGTAAFGGLTSGSIPFINSSKILAEANSALFWDASNSRLGVGTNSPGYRISSDSTIHTATGFACDNNTGLTTISTAGGTQIMNHDIMPSSEDLNCEFRFGRLTSTTGTMALRLHSPGTTTVNHSFVTNNNVVSYMCANNGTVVIGGNSNPSGYKLLVDGSIATNTSIYVGSSTMETSAITQTDSTTKGALIPRMTNAQKLAITSPANGLLVYDTDLTEISYYDGFTWQSSNTLQGMPLPISVGLVSSLRMLKLNKYLAQFYNNSPNNVFFNGYTHGAIGVVSNAYYGGVYSPMQNRIYFVPHAQANQTTWHYYDCDFHRIISYIHNATVSANAYHGGVYVPEVNRIYFIPSGQATVATWHYINCDSGAVVAYTHGVTAVANAYSGGTYNSALGRIYMAPYAQGPNANWHYINATLTTPTATAYAQNNGGATAVTSTSAYSGAIYIPQLGSIYFVPRSQATFSEWHYVDSEGLIRSYTQSVYAGSSVIAFTQGGGYSPVNNRIYLAIGFTNSAFNTWAYISPGPNTVTSYTGASVNGNGYRAAVYSPTQNRIYYVPGVHTADLVYTLCDTATTDTYTNRYTLEINAYLGGIYSPIENSIILIPYAKGNNSAWHRIDEFTSFPVDKGMMSNAVFNKL
jgi:hypothetical protein